MMIFIPRHHLPVIAVNRVSPSHHMSPAGVGLFPVMYNSGGLYSVVLKIEVTGKLQHSNSMFFSAMESASHNVIGSGHSVSD